jgi:hypothetical protein
VSFPFARDADDRESISRIRLILERLWIPGQTCGLPGMTVWRGKPGFESFLVFVSGFSGLMERGEGLAPFS